MKISMGLVGLLVLAAAGCGDDGGDGSGPGPDGPSIVGTYTERYNCDEDGSCADMDESARITITEGAGPGQYDFEEPGGAWSGSGTLSGTTFTWTASEPEYTETGTWIFNEDLDAFSKTSDYTYNAGGGGTCTGEAVKMGNPPAPAAIGGCP